MEKYIEEIADFPLFKGIDRSELQELVACCGATTVQYERGQVILLQGESNTDVWAVISGLVRGAKLFEDGSESSVSVFGKGELFGEILSGGGEPSPVTVSAAERSVVMRIPFDMLARCAGHGGGVQLLKNLFAGIADKYFKQRQRLDILSERTLRGRITAYLKSLFKPGEEQVRVPLSRAQLAGYLCCDRSALSRELSRMKSEGLLDYNGYDFRLLS